MQLVEQHIIKSNNELFSECDRVCLLSKNLYNYANYIVRQSFTNKENSKYLNYYDMNKLLKNEKDYCLLPRKVSNQTLMLLDKNWKSFFASIKSWSKNKTKFTGRPSLPKYLDKSKGRFVSTYEKGAISIKELKKGFVKLSGTNISVKTDKQNINQCRVIPRNGFYIIEIIYTIPNIEQKPDNGRYSSIDLGLNNLATISSNVIKPIIINGKPIKSINQYYNKKLAKLRSNKNSKSKIHSLCNKRNNKVKDYLHKSSRYIVNHLVSNGINTLVVGHNKGWKQDINIGKVNNQKFVNIPYDMFINMLKYKSEMAGIKLILNEESYTSKCSFLDGEDIKKHEKYMGKRVKRGLFKTSSGKFINADLNGSLNILRKVVGNFNYSIEVCSTPRVITLKH
jgi:IS605 OrfB family transposase